MPSATEISNMVSDWVIQSMYNPTREDNEFLTSLGLKWPAKIEHDKRILLGIIPTKDGSKIEIGVTCLPAKLYDFLVYSKQADTTFVVHCGMGSLAQYWPLAEAAVLNRIEQINAAAWNEKQLYFKVNKIEKETKKETKQAIPPPTIKNLWRKSK